MEDKGLTELREKDRILTDLCKKYGKTKHQARFTFLFNMFNRNILNRKEKELVWRTLMETQYLKGTLFGNCVTSDGGQNE